jgi:uncharacterized protein (DUF1501 family)
MPRRFAPPPAASGCTEYRSLDERGASRRGFLRAVAGGGALLLTRSLFPSLPFVAFAQSPRAVDRLVVVFLRGGMDALSAIVPAGEGAALYDHRRATAIPERALLDLDGFFGFHPALAPLHDLYRGGRLAVVHAAGSPDPTRSHFDAMEGMERGVPGGRVSGTGWLARHLESAPWTNDSPFRALAMGTMVPTSLQGPDAALAVPSLEDFRLHVPDHEREALEAGLRALYDRAPGELPLPREAERLFATVRDLRTVAADRPDARPGADYPDTGFGRALRQVAQLIKADMGLEVACVDLGGWDTHEEQGGLEGPFADLLAELAGGLAAFHHDLDDRSERLTVVAMSEFGRMLVENGSAGTDHGRGGSMLVLGGGVRGGVHVEWPGLRTEALDDGDLAITTDFRDVLAEVLVQRLQNPAVDRVFPGYRPRYRGILRPGTV